MNPKDNPDALTNAVSTLLKAVDTGVMPAEDTETKFFVLGYRPILPGFPYASGTWGQLLSFQVDWRSISTTSKFATPRMNGITSRCGGYYRGLPLRKNGEYSA